MLIWSLCTHLASVRLGNFTDKNMKNYYWNFPMQFPHVRGICLFSSIPGVISSLGRFSYDIGAANTLNVELRDPFVFGVSLLVRYVEFRLRGDSDSVRESCHVPEIVRLFIFIDGLNKKSFN